MELSATTGDTAVWVAAAVMQPSVFTGAGDAVPRFARGAYFGLRTELRRLDRSDPSVSEAVAGFDIHTSAALKVPDHRRVWSKRRYKFGWEPCQNR